MVENKQTRSSKVPYGRNYGSEIIKKRIEFRNVK